MPETVIWSGILQLHCRRWCQCQIFRDLSVLVCILLGCMQINSLKFLLAKEKPAPRLAFYLTWSSEVEGKV